MFIHYFPCSAVLQPYDVFLVCSCKFYGDALQAAQEEGRIGAFEVGVTSGLCAAADDAAKATR